MKIKNMQFKSFEARRYTDLTSRPQQVRIDHNSNITQMSEIDKNNVEISFQYTTSYGVMGLIKIEGSLLYEDKNADDILKAWKNSRKMPDEIANKIHTAIMHACIPEAVGIAKNLRLPPPIPLPQVKIGSNAKKGEAGPEVA